MVRQTKDSDKDGSGKAVGPGYFARHWANRTQGAARKYCNSWKALPWKP